MRAIHRHVTVVSFSFALGALVLSGCGGCSSSNGSDNDGDKVSLEEQYEKAMEITRAIDRVRALTEIALLQDEANQVMAVNQTIESALDSCKSIRTAESRAEAFSLLAIAQAQLGKDRDAKSSIREATNNLGEIESVNQRVRILGTIAQAQAEHMEDPAGARATSRQARRLIPEIILSTNRVKRLLEFATIHHKAGQEEECEELIQEAMQQAKEIEDLRKRSRSLGDIAATLHGMKLESQASSAIDAALAAARAIETPINRAHALADVAEHMIAFHGKSSTQPILDEALEASEEVTDEALKAEVRKKIFAL